MNILALSSSPRRNGNTDILLNEMTEAAAELGAQVELIHLTKLTIHPCTQCDQCYDASRCPFKDDMIGLFDKIDQADAIILASPIYFMAHNAQAKLFIDRCQYFWTRKYIRKEPNPFARPGVQRKGIFISVGATHGAKVFAGCITTMKWLYDSLDVDYWGNLLIEGVDEKGAVREHPTAVQDAREMGQRLVESFK